MVKRYEEIIETRYCNLKDQHVTHFVKNQIFQPTGDPTSRIAPIKIVCNDQQRPDCADCDLVIGRTGKKYYE